MNRRRRKRERALISLCSSLLLVVASCSSQNNSPAPPNAATENVVSSTPPFKTKEPERYRATRTITVTADGKATISKSSTARDGDKRRTESQVASRTLIFLNLPEGNFVLLPDEKIYASGSGDSVLGTVEEGEISPEKLLHGDDFKSSYQTLGGEVIGGRKTNKYRVVVNSSSATSVSPSETLIWIDEALGMPIRSETRSSDGTHVSMELSEIELDVAKDVFQIPEDYQKLAFSELLERLNVRK